MNGTLPGRIFICGFMGTGKSTVGKALAEKLEKPFRDLDDFVEKQAEKSISEIFEFSGEEEFRKLERAALLTLIRTQKGVIALGGGTLHNQHLVDHIKVNGLLVLIETPIDVIIERIVRHEHRPLLLDEEGKMKSETILRDELRALYDRRFAFYEQAEITMYTEDYDSVDVLTNELVKKIKYHVALH